METNIAKWKEKIPVPMCAANVISRAQAVPGAGIGADLTAAIAAGQQERILESAADRDDLLLRRKFPWAW